MVQQCRGKVKAKRGKSSLTGLNNVRSIIVRWRASILSLGSGDGIPVLVGQNEVCQKWQNLYSTIQYNMAASDTARILAVSREIST